MDELQIIADDRGLAVIGDPCAVDQFLRSEALVGQEIAPVTLSRVLGGGAVATEAAAMVAAKSGRWIKITEESARKIKEYGLVTNSETGVVHALLGAGGKGGIKGTLQIVEGASSLTNPMVLANVSGLMSQMALQQSMEEMKDFLAEIDLKVDEILRHQKDAVLADVVGVGFLIDDAIAVREQVGRVSEVTWSKIDDAGFILARAEAYALRQVEELGDRLAKGSVKELAKTTEEIQTGIREWLAVIARCVQLQDGLDILELEHVRDAAPDDLERHRRGLRAAREQRIENIARCTGRLVDRLARAAEKGNKQVLMHPTVSPALVRRSNEAAAPVHALRIRLELEPGIETLEARRWASAVADVRDGAIDKGREGVETAKRVPSAVAAAVRVLRDKPEEGPADPSEDATP